MDRICFHVPAVRLLNRSPETTTLLSPRRHTMIPMNRFGSLRSLVRPQARTVRYTLILPVFPRRFLATSAPKPAPKKYTWLKVLLGVGVGGGVLYATNDSFKHLIQTSERVGVVVVATTRCFRLYLNTLNKEFDTPQERSKALSETHLAAAKITLKALETNGGIYIKLGQHITALTYLLPLEWTDTMIPLQDKCPRSSIEDIDAMFRHDYGVSLNDYFSSFDPVPVGVASLAQVHIATLRGTGEKVAVKLQHPSLSEFVPLDIYLTQTVFELMRKVFPEYPLTWLGEELQSSIYVELDFTNEARNAESTAKYFQKFKHLTALRVPEVKSAKPRILIMEYIAGSRLDDLKYMKDNKINTSQVSSCLSHIFNNMIFTPDVGLHCDPHGGNLAIRAIDPSESHNGHNFEIILYDHGLYRNIPLQMKRDYSHFWLSVLDNNIPEMKKYAEKVAGVKGEQKFKIFASAITGRDPNTAMNYDIKKKRSEKEVEYMQSQLQGDSGVLEDLMTLLSSMPRMVLLILKTNDLTRNLDEQLNNPLGPERTFLIMAKYCARVVYDEEKEQNAQRYSRFSLQRFFHNLKSWFSYERRVSSLFVYDLFMTIHNIKCKIGL